MNRNALISTYYKENLDIVCKNLVKFNINIISTGSTSDYISSLGYKNKKIEKITQFKEILDGRVKNLHPKIYASLLYDRKNKKHISTFKKLNFPSIDFVIVNLYPFKKLINNNIEMIDIGGVSLLRAAAKNYKFVTGISNTKNYINFINDLKKNNGTNSIQFRKKMATEIFFQTSKYDNVIYKAYNNFNINSQFENIAIDKIPLRYGENPSQKSYFFKNTKKTFFDYQINGKDLSYNNILDINAGLDCIREFTEPSCAIIKHNNPCGVASAKNIDYAFKKALECDPVSAFGGTIILNKKINYKLSKKLKNTFFEIIVAKSFEKKSLENLKQNKKIILIEFKNLKLINSEEIKSVLGGFVFQKKNNKKIDFNNFKCMTKKKLANNRVSDLIFALKVVKHVKSNAIVLVKNKKTIGIGAGQMSRIDATNLALKKSRNKLKNTKFVAASDAFFPFIDSLKKLVKNNCIGVVQPFGSLNDKKIISFANKNDLPVYFCNERYFKH